jgi:hypothetical protein
MADTSMVSGKLVEGIEYPFYMLGLNTQLKRFLAIAGVTGAGLMAIKPDALFMADGTPRPFYWNNKTEGVYVPFWVYPVAIGLWAGLFI